MTGSDPIRVAIADDHPFVRRGLRGFLEREQGIDVVGEAADGAAAIALVDAAQPDVVLMDLVMPNVDGVEATRRINDEHPDVRIIVLTSFASGDDVMPAVEAGASGYLLKDVEPDDLVAAIRAVHRGQTLWAREVADQLRSRVRGGQTPTRRREDGTPPAPERAGGGQAPVSIAERRALDRLTAREREVLALLGEGSTNADIAARLVVSEKTVKTHVSHILAKLRVDDRTQAAVLAVRAGLVH